MFGLSLFISQVIGYGHFGSVWQGTFQGSSVAVKVFPSELKQWFTKEKDVYILPLMKHSGIVHFLAAGRMGKENVLLLELATEVSYRHKQRSFSGPVYCSFLWTHSIQSFIHSVQSLVFDNLVFTQVFQVFWHWV